MAGTFFSRGREAHGLWTNPENTLLYLAHEQDELPGEIEGVQRRLAALRQPGCGPEFPALGSTRGP